MPDLRERWPLEPGAPLGLASLRADALVWPTVAAHIFRVAKGWGPAVRIVGLMPDAGSKIRIAPGSQPKTSWFVEAAAPAPQAAGRVRPIVARMVRLSGTGTHMPSRRNWSFASIPGRFATRLCANRSDIPRTARGQYARSGPAACYVLTWDPRAKLLHCATATGVTYEPKITAGRFRRRYPKEEVAGISVLA